jgi:taurine transport system substrate-binding protein
MVFFITLLISSLGYSAQEITIGYFNNFPQAELIGVYNKWYEQEMGAKINWRNFNDGGEMMAAMASGNIQIGYAVGMTPFIIALSKGLPLTLISCNMDVDEIDNFVAKNGSNIESPADLVGKKLGVPFGSNCYFKVKSVLKVFRIQENEVQLLDMAGPDIVAAFKRGDIDVGFIWQPFMGELLNDGYKILEARDIGRWGFGVYDVGVVNSKFLEENRDMVVKFIRATEISKRAYYENQEESYKIIANVMGSTPESVKEIMVTLHPWTLEEQLGPNLMGIHNQPGKASQLLKRVADFLVEQKRMDKALEDYNSIVDQSIAEDALKTFN